MRRRQFLNLLAGTAVVGPLAARAQSASKGHRIGVLAGGTEVSQRGNLGAFIRGMRDLGYVEGQDYSVEARFAEGEFGRLPSLAEELLRLDPDLLFASTTPASLAAKAATSTLPIVVVGVADPIGVGLIASLRQPGGNITGITNIVAELTGKRLEFLKRIVPAASKIAVLINPSDPNAPSQVRNAETAAKNLDIQLAPILEIRSGDDLQAAFDAATSARADAALRMVDPLESALRQQTVTLAAQHRLPIIYPFRETVEIGGLASYGTSLPDQYRQAAAVVHKIFSGTKPADIPVEQPTKFELVVNLKTAKALGLTMPATLLAQADEVIE